MSEIFSFMQKIRNLKVKNRIFRLVFHIEKANFLKYPKKPANRQYQTATKQTPGIRRNWCFQWQKTSRPFFVYPRVGYKIQSAMIRRIVAVYFCIMPYKNRDLFLPLGF
jgi:hypothetical protein